MRIQFFETNDEGVFRRNTIGLMMSVCNKKIGERTNNHDDSRNQ